MTLHGAVTHDSGYIMFSLAGQPQLTDHDEAGILSTWSYVMFVCGVSVCLCVRATVKGQADYTVGRVLTKLTLLL